MLKPKRQMLHLQRDPKMQQKAADCPSLAAQALGIAGSEQSKKVLESLIRQDEPNLGGVYRWGYSRY